MTVKELIEILSNVPEDSTVYVWGDLLDNETADVYVSVSANDVYICDSAVSREVK